MAKLVSYYTDDLASDAASFEKSTSAFPSASYTSSAVTTKSLLIGKDDVDVYIVRQVSQ